MTQQPFPAPTPGHLTPWRPSSPAEAGEPRDYVRLLRGPGYAPWRGVLAILMGLAAGGGAVLVIGIVGFVLAMVTGSLVLDDLTDTAALTSKLMGDPIIFLTNNLALASWIPVAMLSVWACFGWRPRWVSSVAPRFRWKWAVVAFLVCLPLQALLMAATLAFDGEPVTWDFSGKAITLVVIVVLTTPLQAAGEEYLFRGLLTQAIGSWIARPVAAVLTSAIVTGLLFSALHGVGVDQDVWLFLGRFVLGLLFSYLTWRTGGLEAASSAHAVNNMVIMVPMSLTGGLGDAVSTSQSSPLSVGGSILVSVLIAALLTWAARRMGVQRVHDPALQPGGAQPPSFGFPAAPDAPAPAGQVPGDGGGPVT